MSLANGSTQRDAESRLRESGLRVTPQRLAVLDFLTSTDRHPTADEVGSAVNDRFPTVSRASVYNVLRSLRGVGLVREVIAGNAITRYDAKTAPHHHFVCRDCGAVEDMPWSEAPAIPSPTSNGRSIDGFEVVFHGRCAGCMTA